jgi:hypothetical protein
MPILVPYINRELLYDSQIVGCLRDIIKMLFIIRIRIIAFIFIFVLKFLCFVCRLSVAGVRAWSFGP